MEEVFSTFVQVVNIIYDSKVQFNMKTPAYSIMRVMVVAWRRTILEEFTQKIIESVSEIIAAERKNYIKNAEVPIIDNPKDEKELEILSRTTQSFIDLSVNELSVQFINHSKFNTDGVYGLLENQIIRNTREFYDSLVNLPMKVAENVLVKDFMFIQRSFLPSTWAEIEKKMIEIRLMMLRDVYLGLYQEFKVEDFDIEGQPLLDTHFAKMLFDSNPGRTAKNHIKVFIKYMVNNNLTEDIYKYNSLFTELDSLSQENVLDDEEIEYKNQELGLSLSLTYEESVLFSMTKEIGFEEFMTISANKAYS